MFLGWVGGFFGIFLSVLFSFIQMTDTDFFVRMFSIFVVQLESIVLIDIFLFFTILGHFVPGDIVFSCPGGCRRHRAASLEVPGAQGKPRAPEWWPESSRRGLGRLSA